MVDKPMYLSAILEHTARFRHDRGAHYDVGGFSVPTSVVFPASASALYILMICCRNGLKMDIPLWFVLFHNAAMIALALLVLVGTLVGAYERSLEAGLGGIAGLFCPPQQLASDQLMTGTLGFFLYIFHLSKYVELVDTFILIAKGKKILFLHCYHHCSMLFVTWSWFAFPWLEGAWWCAVVNSIIHSFMYYYYLRTAIPGTKIWWGKYLTSGQIFQFFTGMVVVGYAFALGTCAGDKRTAVFSTAVNVSFFGLFLKFFFEKYDEKPGSASPKPSGAPQSARKGGSKKEE